MNRRHWLQLSSAALACAGHSARSAPSATTTLKAGAFSVDVPAEWAKTAVIEKVPLMPLYDADEWKKLQEEPSFRKKPGYICRPQHRAVRLPAALPQGIPADLENAGDDATAPQILIHKASEWATVFTDGRQEQPNSKRLLSQMRSSMDAALTKDDQHVSPGYMDASMIFMCLKQKVEFDGGHGVRLLGQWTNDADIMRRGSLHYLFLGMSKDSSCQIIATFPVDLPGLPAADGTDHLGRSIKRYEEFNPGRDAYEKEAKQWLEKNAATITPSLETLDAMMSSLVVRTWA